jgi:hypothetical protein
MAMLITSKTWQNNSFPPREQKGSCPFNCRNEWNASKNNTVSLIAEKHSRFRDWHLFDGKVNNRQEWAAGVSE